MTHPIIEEEQALLARVLAALERQPVRARPSESAALAEIERLREQLLSAAGADDHGAASAELSRQTALLRQLREARPAAPVARESPYFGHLRLREAGRTWDICLGKTTFIAGGVNIVDWRNAPIARLFYRYRQGEEYEETIAERTREGVVAARRTVVIRDARLQRVDSPEGVFAPDADGEWQQRSTSAPRLAGSGSPPLRHDTPPENGAARFGAATGGPPRRADKHLPAIAALLDREQFDLISRSSTGLVVVRGGAGSGKTTVALHRIAFLAYDDPGIDSPSTLVVLFSPALRDYVAHVLPALGVTRARALTFREWAHEQRRALLPMLPARAHDDAPSVVQKVLQHPAMAAALAEQVRRVEARPTPRQVIDDWASATSDPRLIADAVARCAPESLTAEVVERACDWNRRRQAEILAALDGEPATTRAAEDDADGAAEREIVSLIAEDDALLLRAWQLRIGPLRDRHGRTLRYRHVAIDEVQDFSPLEVRVLIDCLDERRSMTLAGDTQQHVLQDSGFTSWSDFFRHLEIGGTEVETLRISYRSTREIMDFALALLGPLREDDEAPATTRSGPPVEYFRFTDHGACVAFLGQALEALAHEEPLASVALLTPSPTLSALYYEGLRLADVPRLGLVRDQRYSFAPGVEITEAQAVKGLEFDYVVVVEASAGHYGDTPAARRLLHVAATRAIHQLWLTSVATPSPLLRAALGDTHSGV